MIFINPNNEYPRYVGDLQLENPGWAEGQALPEGWKYVEDSIPPEFTANNQVLEEGFPALDENGIYQRNWSIRSMTAEELEVVNAPITAREKLKTLGLTEVEIDYLARSLR